MSDYYPVKKKRNSAWNYGGEKWKLSRSKIDLFSECPRCFYLDNKLGIIRPKFPAFTLNVAVDGLLKKEFDIHRAKKTSHPLMDTYGIDAVPFSHKDVDTWRENFEGVQFLHKPTGLLVSGAIDDVWVNKEGELLVVDYKATAKDGAIDDLDDTKWHDQYRRQMEVYQWLLRQNGFKVSNTGYFVYVNGKKDKESFDGKLEFDVTIIPYTGSDNWIEKKLEDIKKCLESKNIPKSGEGCEYCAYIDLIEKETKDTKDTKGTLF
ncbi:MAG: PD-(D/E)XK nuclease family protein [Candidatus Paceibacterota bacterium]